MHLLVEAVSVVGVHRSIISEVTLCHNVIFFLHKSHNVITGVSFLSAIFQCTVKCDVDEDIMFFFNIPLYCIPVV